MHLRFMDAVKKDTTPNQTFLRGRAVTIERDWPIEIPKIDPRKDSSFALYIINMSQQFVSVTPPSEVFLMDVELDQSKRVPIIQSTSVMYFPPHQDNDTK
jgi:hypothetical protein